MEIKFEPRDLWIGIYWCMVTEWEAHWSATNYDSSKPSYRGTEFLKIYVCIIPMLPIIFKIDWYDFKNMFRAKG